MQFRLVLMITERCNIRCKHCLFGERELMNQGKDMPLDDIKSYIDQMSQIAAGEKKNFTVDFSGGEPILCFSELLDAVRYARTQGASSVTSMTNGFWGADKVRAKEIVIALKEAGLDALCFSIDDFHQEYVPLSSILTALNLCREHSLVTSIKSTVTKKTRRLADVLSDLGDLLLNRPLIVEEIPCYPQGRAVKRIPPADLFYEKGIPHEQCPAGLMLAVLPDGTVYPCCGACWSAALSIGNARKTAIEELFYKAKNDSVLNILREKGPAHLLPYFKQSGYSLPEEGYVGYCDLCQVVLNHPAFSEVSPLAIKDWRKERVKKVMADLLSEDEFLLAKEG